MSQNTWKSYSTTSQLNIVQLEPKIDVHVPDDVLNKIKYLCKEIPKVEWSGILLYDIEGTITKPETLKVFLKDIIPMNKGNATYTEYNFNEKKRDSSGYEDKHIDYIEENPEAFDWKMGHIHSHNIMNVFFSGTDKEELYENSGSHDFYLSVIVNNWMDIIGKIAIRATAHKQVDIPYYATDENGKSYKIEDAKFNVTKDKVYLLDCNIIANFDNREVDSTFSNNVFDIIEKAKPKPVEKTYTAPVAGFKPGATDIPANKPAVPVTQKPSDIAKGIKVPYDELETMTFDEAKDEIELFTIALLRGSNPSDSNDDIEIALEEIKIFENEISAMEMAKSIVESYPAMYEKHFEAFADDSNHFVLVTDGVIDVLEDYEGEYSFLSKMIISLKYMLNKFEEHGQSAV